MDSRKNQITLLTTLILIFLTLNYSYFDKTLEEILSTDKFVTVTRIVDGDTVVVDGNTTIRLLGINCPERGEKYYDEAKIFLNESILNKSLKLFTENADSLINNPEIQHLRFFL